MPRRQLHIYAILFIAVANINVMTERYHGTERPAPARSLKFVSVYLYIHINKTSKERL